MSSVLKACLITGLVLSLTPQALTDDEKPKEEAQKTLADFEALKKYEPTGEVKRCISLNRIGRTKVLDDKTIFFKMRGKKHYVNRMKYKCPSLKREERFMYKTSIGRLCSIDTITVLDSFGRSWASCGLGKFEEVMLKPKPDPEQEEKTEGKS